MSYLFKTALIILLTFCFLLTPMQASAAPNFTTDYKVTYTVLENELTRAALTVTLTNTTTQYYASSYQMQLGFSEITNLTAADPDGELKPKITKTNDGYLLDITFNKKAVGQGDKLTFTITFDTKEVARKHGQIWEINVPGISNPEEFQSFVVTVKVPESFGKPTYIKPDHHNPTLTFTKEQLGKSGIAIAFGDKQLYAFDLEYHLQNKNLFPIKSEIALPPTTNYQDIFITGMEPQPENVRLDKDGNWLAQYNLLPAQKLDINVRGNAAVHLIPKSRELSLEDYAFYTRGMEFWETTDPEIMRLAQELQTPEAIYNYVIKTLKYDFTRITQESARMGAAAAQKNPNAAVCREFTDLFIAISRAAGIPAREINGFAYTENPRLRPISLSQDILHSWPEYYDKDKKTWVMVDPTWGSTTGGIDYFHKIDNDHIAFVVKGSDSKLPLPAGAYKLDSDSGLKDVTVGFAKEITHTDPEVSITSAFSDSAISGFPITGNVLIKNTGSRLVQPQLFSVYSEVLTPREQAYQYQAIPPFGYTTVPVKFHPTKFLTNTDAVFTIRYTPPQAEGELSNTVLGASTDSAQQINVEERITVTQLFKSVWGIGGIIVIFAFIIFIAAAKSGRIPLPRRRG